MKRTVFVVIASSVVLAAGGLLAVGQERVNVPVAATGPATAPAPAGEVAGGEWKSAEGVLTQGNMDMPALLLFGNASWKDYTVELEGQKTEGDEGFLIAVRAKDAEHLVWFNVGGWGNTRTAFELLSDDGKVDFGDGQTYGSFAEVQTGKWHKLKVTVSGNTIEGFLDGKSACKVTAATGTLAAGRVGVGTWSTLAKFRNITVTVPSGMVVWDGVPGVGGLGAEGGSARDLVELGDGHKEVESAGDLGECFEGGGGILRGELHAIDADAILARGEDGDGEGGGEVGLGGDEDDLIARAGEVEGGDHAFFGVGGAAGGEVAQFGFERPGPGITLAETGGGHLLEAVIGPESDEHGLVGAEAIGGAERAAAEEVEGVGHGGGGVEAEDNAAAGEGDAGETVILGE
jgi:hypothetical protein